MENGWNWVSKSWGIGNVDNNLLVLCVNKFA